MGKNNIPVQIKNSRNISVPCPSPIITIIPKPANTERFIYDIIPIYKNSCIVLTYRKFLFIKKAPPNPIRIIFIGKYDSGSFPISDFCAAVIAGVLLWKQFRQFKVEAVKRNAEMATVNS